MKINNDGLDENKNTITISVYEGDKELRKKRIENKK